MKYSKTYQENNVKKFLTLYNSWDEILIKDETNHKLKLSRQGLAILRSFLNDLNEKGEIE